MKQLSVVLLAWTLWLDVRVIPLDAAPSGGRVPTAHKFESLKACETAIERKLADIAIGRPWTSTVDGYHVVWVTGKNEYVAGHLCVPDSFEPREMTEVG